MAANLESIRDIADRELVFTRVFDAPRELVFEAWTQPKHLVNWWGPSGFTTTIQEMDVRPGGTWRLVMRGPDGTDYRNRMIFVEVVKPERLVYKLEPEAGTEPVSFETTVTFADQGAKTGVTMRMVFPSPAARDHVVKKYGAVEGAHQTLDRLGEQLLRMASLVMTRIFDAPREVVFQAWTDPERMRQWWGPRNFTNPVCEIDARPGGAILIHMRGPDGTVYPMAGVYQEVSPPERLVFSNAALDEKGNALFEVLNVITFAEEAGKTKLTLVATVIKETAGAARHLAGMEQGWSETLDRLMESVGAEIGAETPWEIPNDFSITRVFDAPRDLVWKALTESERLMHWWGPKGFTMVTCAVDLRLGGTFRYCMRAPNGHEMWGKWVYREIDPPERLVTVVSFTDRDGNPVRHPMSATWPLEVLNAVTLTEEAGKTTMTISGGPINATGDEHQTFDAAQDSMRQGYTGTLDQLADYLSRG